MISCTDLRCKHRSDKTGKCKRKNVILTQWGVQTLNMGFKNFHECKSFEFDDEYLKLQKKIKKVEKVKGNVLD